MSTHTEKLPQGIAVLVDKNGELKKVIHDTFNLFADGSSGERSFFDCLEGNSKQKGRTFMESLRKNGVAYAWELHITNQSASSLFSFSGVRVGEENLLIGTPDKNDTEQFLDGLMEMNNEQVNKLRSFMKEQKQDLENEKEWKLYDEMSGLNNELANMQRKLTKKTAELERMNEFKNQMLGTAAHDLRNPLTLIQNYAMFLIDDHQEEEIFNKEQYQLIKKIKESSEYMVRIIEDMIDMSALESGSINLQLEEHDIADIVKRTAELNSLSAKKKDIKITLELPESPVIKEIDFHKFQQVLDNLISNAVKYSNADTEVRVGIKELNQDSVQIFVKDHGQGIPKDEIDKLFEPFSNLSVEPTAGEKSTGLGLAITKKITEAHGGDIEVETEVGAGSTFTVILP